MPAAIPPTHEREAPVKQYLELLHRIKAEGVKRLDRTGTGTLSVFGHQMRFDLEAGFPLLTTKKVHIPSIVHELLWFLRGDSNIQYLKQHKVRIWDEWADADGELGPVYGRQWRAWQTPDGRSIDQIQSLMDGLRRDPGSRRHVVSAWNVSDLETMALPPCHAFFQVFVAEGKVHLMLTQRSVDAFLGLPFNIASYSLLTHMIAQQLGLQPGTFIWSGGDCHLYLNHLAQVEQQLTREPFPLPSLRIGRRPDSIFDYRFEDFEFADYQAHPHIKGQVSV